MVDIFDIASCFQYLCDMKRAIKIYILKDPKTQEIRYVGKTIKSLKHRLSLHISSSIRNKRKTYKEAWITGLYLKKLKPIIELIEVVSEENWQEKEIYWISQYTNLTNTALGGQGGTGIIYTEAERLKKSIMMKKLISEGKIDYKARALKISISHRGKVLSEITKEKLRQCNLGKTQTWEQKLKTSKGGVLRIDLQGNIIEFLTLQHAVDNTQGASKSNISSACNGRLKTYLKYKWQYKNKDIVDS